jgi:hypothetical protein
MKHIKEFNEFINEQKTYKDLESDLRKTFEKTGIAKRCYNGEINVGGSFWHIGHPNGSVNVTFWLMDKVPVDKLNKTAKEWAKKHDLIAATFYPNGIKDNIEPKKNQDWTNAAAQNAKYVYGFAFYTDSYSMKNIYKPLTENLNEDLSATISDPELEAAWLKVYGKEFKEDFPQIFKIMKQRAKMDSRELERIWNETHETSFKEEHPKVWNILFSDK